MLLPVLRNEVIKETKDIKSWATKLISGCRDSLAEIIDFTSNELQFLKNIIEHGEITPELLTADNNLMELIKRHPVLLWKAMNVREYNKRI